MRGPLRIVAVVLLSFSLGLHWVALQSVAWTSMLVNRVQQGSVANALRTTFDGNHPCPLCLVVREGRAAERQNADAPGTPGTTYSPKLELIQSADPIRLIPNGLGRALPVMACFRFDSRSDPPPLPPPRFA